MKKEELARKLATSIIETNVTNVYIREFVGK